MGSKQKDKILSKQIIELREEVKDLSGKLEHLDEFFKSVHGNSPEVLNLHFVLSMLQESYNVIQHADYTTTILQEYIEVHGLNEDYKTWLDAKANKYKEEKEKERLEAEKKQKETEEKKVESHV
jgi:hypothetical protein